MPTSLEILEGLLVKCVSAKLKGEPVVRLTDHERYTLKASRVMPPEYPAAGHSTLYLTPFVLEAIELLKHGHS